MSDAVCKNLVQPYGDGNHRRISWRKAWDVNRELGRATHRDTGFEMTFERMPEGGFQAWVSSELPWFGPDARTALAQIDGLRQLQVDGWEIFHTVMRKPA